MANQSPPLNYTSNKGKETANKISLLLKEGNSKEKESYNRLRNGLQEVTLVLGNTGAGKSTFTHWISDNDANFISKEDEQTPGEYVIIDSTSTSIINTATTVSTTVFPQLVVDEKKNSYYYDFPGFADTRGVAHDIVIAWFIKKAIDNSNKIKMVFVVKYDSVTGKAVRDDFTNLVRHVCKFVTNIDKFRDGIALIATRVKNNVPREKVIDGITIFIKKAKEALEEEERKEHVDHTMEKKLMDVFLTKEVDNYPKIGLFLTPDVKGNLRNIPLLQENKKKVTAMLDKLKFIERKDSDFGYTIPKQSLIDVDGIINEMNNGISSCVINTGKEIQRYTSNKEEKLCDILELYDEANSRYNELLKIKEEANKQTDPMKCVQHLFGVALILSDNIRNIKTTAGENAVMSSFLQTVSGNVTRNSFKCAEGLNEVIEYSNHSKKWYQFLINFYDDMSEYQAQRNRGNGPCIYLIKGISENKQSEKKPNILDPFLKECFPHKRYDLNDLSGTKLNKSEFNALTRVLNLALNYDLFKSCSDGKLVIKGQYIKFIDIQTALQDTCHESPKFIEIFALNKVFVDTDLNLTGLNIHLSVISPIWDVQGSRKIILDGSDGNPHNPQRASSGRASGESGQNGAPGLPGGHGGNFFGIGETFINFSDLTISVKGGKGGPGQDGGDGIAGTPGKDAYNDLYRRSGEYYSRNHDIIKGKVLNYFIGADESVYILGGKAGTSGGNGGNGGRGGTGGYPGDITMISAAAGSSINFKMERSIGNRGSNGYGGQGALGGMAGRDLKVYLDHNKLAFLGIGHDDVEETPLEFNSMGRATSGRNGGTGENYEMMVEPTQNNPLPNRRNIVNSYMLYLEANLNCNSTLKQSQLREFLNHIKNSDNVRNRLRKRRSIDLVDYKSNVNYKSQTAQDNQITLDLSNEQGLANHDEDMDIKSTYLVTEDANHASNSANRFSSPISTIVNSVTKFIGQLVFFNVNIMNYQLVRGGSESIFGQWKQSNILTNTKGYTNHTSHVSKFNVNESLALADFAIRCVTKMKPYFCKEQAMDFSEVRAFALKIIEKFEKVSSELYEQYDLPPEYLDFDPIILMSKVEREIIDQNYSKIGELLIQSVMKSPQLNDARIYNFVRREIDEILWEQNENELYSHHKNEDRSDMITMRTSLCHISHQWEVNYLPTLK